MARYAYWDSSAIVKLVVAEAETTALEYDALAREGLLTSRLGAAEVTRAAHRGLPKRLLQHADDVLASFVLLDVTPPIWECAGRLNPDDLRTLDAIHLATALTLDPAEVDFVTYDAKLAAAARIHKLHVIQPGR